MIEVGEGFITESVECETGRGGMQVVDAWAGPATECAAAAAAVVLRASGRTRRMRFGNEMLALVAFWGTYGISGASFFPVDPC